MFLIGLILLLLIIVTLTHLEQDRNTYKVTMRFQQAQGILEGAVVRVAGVQVGRVTSVDFDSMTNKAQVIARVNHSVHLYSNYHYTIGIGGLVGERYVEILPVERNRGGMLVDGSSIEGKTTPDMNELFETTNDLLARLTNTADSLNKIVASTDNQRNVHDSLANFKKTTANVADFTSGLNQMVQRDASSVDNLIANLRDVSEEARQVSDSLGPQLRDTHIVHTLENASDKVLTITTRFEQITEAFGSMVNDKGINENLRATLSNLRKTSDDLNSITAQVRVASASLPQMANNLAHASNDLPIITGNLARASNDLPAIIDPIRQITPETSQNFLLMSRNWLNASNNANNLTKSITSTTSGFSSWHFKPAASVSGLLTHPTSAHTEANLDVLKSKSLFRVGVVGVHNRSFVNLQAGNKLSDKLWLRYGMVQSHLGAGADYLVTPDFVLTDELFNPNHLRMNVLLNYHPRQFPGPLWLDFGAYDLFQHSSLGLGLTYRP